MGCVPGEQHVAPAHGLGDETAEDEHGLVADRSLLEGEAVRAVHDALHDFPDAVVGPVRRIGFRVALEVHPLQGLGALTHQGEAVLGVGIDEFRSTRRSLHEEPEPGERVLLEVVGALGLGDLVATDAARTVSAN